LIGLAAATSLILAPLAAAGPANAIDAGNGIISVNLVDDLGQPVTGMVQLYTSGEDSPLYLGMSEGAGVPVANSSFTQEIPSGTYGALVIGGWAGMTCVGLSACSPALASTPTLGADAFTVPDGGTKSLIVTIATPKLTGTPGVGMPLTVSVPSSLKELGSLAGGLAGGLPTEPTIAWNRNGAPIGAAGPTYTPTTADAGGTVSATLTYPPLLSMLLSMSAPGTTPPPFTTAAVSISKLSPSVKLSVPGKIKKGKRPTAYVNVTYGQSLVGGVVTFSVGKLRSQQAVLRSGLATFKLPKLKPGKHKITASFAASGAYNAAKTTKTVVVKGKKAKKGKGKGKKK
jgi:hypothetical protein